MLPAALTGTVKKFKGDGRKLGYPTANLTTATDLRDGVYFGRADLADFKDQPALIFIGTPTTLGEKSRRIEAYLLDIPDVDHYGQRLNLRLEHYHRSNQTFSTLDELIAEMRRDEASARTWFSSGSARP